MHASAPTQLRILLIEDEENDAALIRALLGRVLQQEAVRCAGSLAEATMILESGTFSPDVILADLLLGDATGAEVLVSLHRSVPQIPVIVLSGVQDRNTIALAWQEHAQDFIAKDWVLESTDPVSLLLRITKVVERFANHRNMMQVLDCSPSGIVVLGATGRIRFCNRRAREMFGERVDLSIGAEFGITTADGTAQIQTLNGVTLEMQTTDIEWNQQPARLVTLQDISHHIRLEEKLQASNQSLAQRNRAMEAAEEALRDARALAEARAQQAEAASRTKSEFLANMSHELRTPLNAMLVLAGVWAHNDDDTLPADLVDHARMIHESGVSLLQIINEILDLAKVESGKLEILPVPNSVADLCQRLERRYGPMAHEKNLRLQVSIGQEVPERVLLDRERTEQVLGNLIGNAVKFTETGSISIEVETRVDDTRCWLQIRVRDTGIGIVAENTARIFEPFEQGEAGLDRRYGGTGLGLTISHRIAVLMGGTIRVQSTPGAGSCFTFEVPLIAPGEPESADANARSGATGSAASGRKPARQYTGATPSPLAGIGVLIVDDDMRNVFALSALCRAQDMVVHRAPDAERALELLARHGKAIRIMLTDIMMPKMDGISLVRKVRADSRHKDLVILVLTARHLDDDPEQCREAGANRLLHKPVDDADLLDAMRAAVAAPA